MEPHSRSNGSGEGTVGEEKTQKWKGIPTACGLDPVIGGSTVKVRRAKWLTSAPIAGWQRGDSDRARHSSPRGDVWHMRMLQEGEPQNLQAPTQREQ